MRAVADRRERGGRATGVAGTGCAAVKGAILGTSGGDTVCRKDAVDPMHSNTPPDGMAADAA